MVGADGLEASYTIKQDGMKRISFVIWALLPGIQLNAQSWDCQIRGTTRKNSGVLVPNCAIIILRNADTLCIAQTDNTGSFDLTVPFHSGNDYTLLCQTYATTKTIPLFHKTDSVPVLSFVFDIALEHVKRDQFDNTVYYDFGETREFDNFDLTFLKYTLEENPGICIEFVQSLNPEEGKAIARKRMKYFRRFLLESGIDSGQIRFSKRILELNIIEVSDDRSRIQGVVRSTDGPCRK